MFIIFERLSILIKKTISIIPDRTWRIKTALSVLTSRAMTCVQINGCSRQFVCFWLGFLIFSPFKMDKTCTVINCNQILCWWYSGLKDAAFHVLFWMTSQQTTCSGSWNCQLDWVIRQLWKTCCPCWSRQSRRGSELWWPEILGSSRGIFLGFNSFNGS